MEINRNTLESLLNLTDAELQKQLGALAAAAGIDPRQLSGAAKNMDQIRFKMEHLTDADIARAAQAIGEDNIQRIVDAAKNGR